MHNLIMAALLVLFSIKGVASAAAEDDIFEIEAEGSYQMEAGSSIYLGKKVKLVSSTEEKSIMALVDAGQI